MKLLWNMDATISCKRCFQIILTHHSWPRLCHLYSPFLHHRGALEASSDSCCHSGEHSPQFASYTAVHQSGPDSEVHHHTPGPCLYTFCHGHTGTDLFGCRHLSYCFWSEQNTAPLCLHLNYNAFNWLPNKTPWNWDLNNDEEKLA